MGCAGSWRGAFFGFLRVRRTVRRAHRSRPSLEYLPSSTPPSPPSIVRLSFCRPKAPSFFLFVQRCADFTAKLFSFFFFHAPASPHRTSCRHKADIEHNAFFLFPSHAGSPSSPFFSLFSLSLLFSAVLSVTRRYRQTERTKQRDRSPPLQRARPHPTPRETAAWRDSPPTTTPLNDVCGWRQARTCARPRSFHVTHVCASPRYIQWEGAHASAETRTKGKRAVHILLLIFFIPQGLRRASSLFCVCPLFSLFHSRRSGSCFVCCGLGGREANLSSYLGGDAALILMLSLLSHEVYGKQTKKMSIVLLLPQPPRTLFSSFFLSPPPFSLSFVLCFLVFSILATPSPRR